jgi:hypothetical protein
MQHIICGNYSAEIFPIYRNWVAQPLYRVAVYNQGDLIYENLEGDPSEAVRVVSPGGIPRSAHCAFDPSTGFSGADNGTECHAALRPTRFGRVQHERMVAEVL